MTDTQRPPELPPEFGPEFDEPPGHALSTRGYIVMAAIPFVIAAVAMSLLWWHYDPSQTVEGKNIPVLLSPWHPGSPSNDTVISGRLELGSDRCVTLRSDDGRTLTPVFPAGYVATQIEGGRVNLYDTGHHVIATTATSCAPPGRSPGSAGTPAGRARPRAMPPSRSSRAPSSSPSSPDRPATQGPRGTAARCDTDHTDPATAGPE